MRRAKRPVANDQLPKQPYLDYPLSPKIHIPILQTDLYIFPYRGSWENLIKDQSISSLVIISLILITLSLDKVWILLGENWSRSPLGLKGLSIYWYMYLCDRHWAKKLRHSSLQHFTTSERSSTLSCVCQSSSH